MISPSVQYIGTGSRRAAWLPRGGPWRCVAALSIVSIIYVVSSTGVRHLKRDVQIEVDGLQQDQTTKTSQFSFARFLPTCSGNKSTPTEAVADDGQFPPDLFTQEQRQKGAVILHLAGLIYMFVALAIVCDEFFVPSLAVLTEKLAISDDVAGATFMAAGGSAPEFFTSVIGVFIAQNNVGIGTIVGSATFNILCVLACCTLFSNTVLQLTWWPLFRDVTIYMIALFMLVVFFMDEQITWPEALSLFLVYLGYAAFMKFNASAEVFVKTKILGEVLDDEDEMTDQLGTNKTETTPVENGHTDKEPSGTDETHLKIMNEHVPREDSHDRLHRINSCRSGDYRRRSSLGRRQSIPILHSGTMFRNGIMHLMSNTLQEVPEGSDDASSNGRISPAVRSSQKTHTALEVPSGTQEPPNRRHSVIEEIKSLLEEEEEKPLDMQWPDEPLKRLTYILLAPILIPMWVTIPDVRRESCRVWYPFTFIASILWIAFFSYLMVWWANTIGETLVIPTEVIGLTILAAGTSIPDLITSVIVARKGLGDMAVSSSVGSNIFDVCVGLPVPWLLFFIIEAVRNPDNPATFISVSSKGLLCSVGMLFIMLVVLVFAIFVSKWKMNKAFGVIMIVSYVAFCFFSVFLETDRMTCPLNIC